MYSQSIALGVQLRLIVHTIRYSLMIEKELMPSQTASLGSGTRHLSLETKASLHN